MDDNITNQLGPLALCIQGLALYAPWVLATVQRQGWHQKREGRLNLWAKVFALRALTSPFPLNVKVANHDGNQDTRA